MTNNIGNLASNNTTEVASNNQIGSGNLSPTFNVSFSANKEGKKIYLDQFAEIIERFRKGEISAEIAHDKFLIYANFSKMFGWVERKKLMKLAVNLLTKTDESEKVCDNNLEQIDLIVQNILCEVKTEKVAKLLRKALEKILNGEEVSLSTVKLIEGYQDSDIDKIKELLGYTQLSTTSVLYYVGIEKDFQKKGLCRNNSDRILFLNEIFDSQRSTIPTQSHAVLLKPANVDGFNVWTELRNNHALNEEWSEFKAGDKLVKNIIVDKCKTEVGKKEIENWLKNNVTMFSWLNMKFSISKQPTDTEVLNVELGAFVILTAQGQQIYDLLKDEIGEVPSDYFEKVKKHIESQYQNIGLTVTASSSQGNCF